MTAADRRTGRSSKVSDEELLNVFRDASTDTLTTPELAERLPIGDRATQQRVAELNAEGRVLLDRGGATNRWKLAPTEPQDPVYSADVAAAKRRQRRAYATADRVFVYAIGLVSAAGISMAYHVFFLFVGMDAPVISRPALPVVASGFGLVGSICFLTGFGLKLYGYLVERAVRE